MGYLKSNLGMRLFGVLWALIGIDVIRTADFGLWWAPHRLTGNEARLFGAMALLVGLLFLFKKLPPAQSPR